MHNESAKLPVWYNRLHFYLKPQSYTVSWILRRSVRTVIVSCLISLADIGKVTWLIHNSFLFIFLSLSWRSDSSSIHIRSMMFGILMVSLLFISMHFVSLQWYRIIKIGSLILFFVKRHHVKEKLSKNDDFKHLPQFCSYFNVS